MSFSSSVISPLPWLAIAWVATVVVVAVLIYLIARAVLDRTDPHRLPEVLNALTPLLTGVARALTHLPSSPPVDQKPSSSAPVGQTEDTAPKSAGEAS